MDLKVCELHKFHGGQGPACHSSTQDHNRAFKYYTRSAAYVMQECNTMCVSLCIRLNFAGHAVASSQQSWNTGAGLPEDLSLLQLEGLDFKAPPLYGLLIVIIPGPGGPTEIITSTIPLQAWPSQSNLHIKANHHFCGYAL